MNIFKKIIKSIFEFIKGIITIFKDIIKSILNFLIKHWLELLVVFLQPLVIVFSCFPLLNLITDIIINKNIVSILIATFLMLPYIFTVNIVIELVYHLTNNSENYENLQNLLQYFNNFTLLLISLIALFSSAFPFDNEQLNQELFIFGLLYFLTTIYSDAYRILIFRKGTVKTLSIRLKNIWLDC